MIVGTSVVAAAVLALTGYVAFSGDDDTAASGKDGKDKASASPSESGPGYSPPEEWTEPKKWAALPRGKKTDDHGNEVNFPHSADGAVAMLAASNETEVKGSQSMVDERMSQYDSYLSKADQTPENKEKIKAEAVQTDASVRQKMGVPGSGDMPSGAYMRSTTVGYKVIEASKNEVSVYLLSRVTMKAGELEKERGSHTRNILAAEWNGSDWKLSTAASVRAGQQAQNEKVPAIVAPGDAKFNASGWTAIRQAS
ncbi:hypothetical protein TPA0910_44560 [Streptomyces hygroscopicus subsp. sporocinereus]|uniref:Secreted protein n=2 Tax=Streptomyces hygroscopicus TaxID=1912 RepID=A0ABQ3U4B0_STRHY|nr:hypothetical protein TPA0910_44560 [Streptomyces hygroscopicus]